jgi:biopolymer transport protein ExbB
VASWLFQREQFVNMLVFNLLAQETDVSAVHVRSIWDFVVKGGPMMIPIGICSLIALTITVERLISLRRSRIIPPDFLGGLKKVLSPDAAGRARALDYCKINDSPVAAVVATGIKRLGEPLETLERHIQESGEREVAKLRKFLRVLSVIASIAPLMGLLGTIFGMIRAFSTVAASAEALGRTEQLAQGIYEAMITTAAGLLVAIPVLIAYHWIAAKLDRLVAEIDQMTVEFIEEYALSGSPRNAADGSEAGVAAAEAAPPPPPNRPRTGLPPAIGEDPIGTAVPT